ncbi:hypothetical protein HXX76_001526 [Chlamydomonas incerta]|uniref:Uncharacterized protein n=1 Tax=Chlamydomonas incerta TaxID=51695 RepID=A0A835WCB3_CHLIN|nr:hypothetical protein HXX76_001526 [Chlamydomonas incerta]|eukprot:KAG2444783.1 hypothetical protein HXX76_001526 [Chlamydomonas incerta]
MCTDVQLTSRTYRVPRFDWGSRCGEVTVACQETWPGDAFAAYWRQPEAPWRTLSLARRHRMLCLAASSHHAASLEAALARSGVGLDAAVLEAAAVVGDLAACKRLKAQGCPVSRLSLRAAAFSGHQAVVEYIMANLDPVKEPENWRWDHPCTDAAVYAAAGGHAAVLEWAAARRRGGVVKGDCFAACLMAAAHNGRGELLERLLLQRGWGGGRLARAMRAWLRKRDTYCTSLLELAAQHCPAATLRRLHAHWVPRGRVDWVSRFSPAWLVARAAVSPTPDWEEKAAFLLGQVDPGALTAPAASTREAQYREMTEDQEAEDKSYDIGVAVEQDVAGWGAVTVPEFAARLGCLAGLAAHGVTIRANWRRELAEVLIRAGNVAALRELLSIWDSWVADSILQHSALQRGAVASYMALFELLRERRGHPGRFTMEHAMAAAQHSPYSGPCLRYLAELEGELLEPGMHGTGGTWDGVFAEAARRGADVAVLRVLRERRGAALDLEAVAAGGSVEAVEWAAGELRAAGQAATLTPDQLVAVATGGNLIVADWAVKHGLAQQA